MNSLIYIPLNENNKYLYIRHKLELIRIHLEKSKELGLEDIICKNYTDGRAIRNMNKPGYTDLIIYKDNKDCGIVSYRKIKSDIDNKPIIYISSLFIKTEFRRQGIATEIIKYIKHKENLRIELEVWYSLESNEFYKSLGFKELKTRYTY